MNGQESDCGEDGQSSGTTAESASCSAHIDGISEGMPDSPAEEPTPIRAVVRDDCFWQMLSRANEAGEGKLAALCADADLEAVWDGAVAPLAYYSFVIPERTSFECIRCADCCRAFMDPLTGEPLECVFLTAEKACKIYPARPVECRFFPFHLVTLGVFGKLLVVSDACPGIGHGKIISGARYEELTGQLETEAESLAARAKVRQKVLYWRSPEGRWMLLTPERFMLFTPPGSSDECSRDMMGEDPGEKDNRDAVGGSTVQRKGEVEGNSPGEPEETVVLERDVAGDPGGVNGNTTMCDGGDAE